MNLNSLTTLGATTILLAISDNPNSAIDTLELKVKYINVMEIYFRSAIVGEKHIVPLTMCFKSTDTYVLFTNT